MGAEKRVTWSLRRRAGDGGCRFQQPPKMPERGVRAPHAFPWFPQPHALLKA